MEGGTGVHEYRITLFRQRSRMGKAWIIVFIWFCDLCEIEEDMSDELVVILVKQVDDNVRDMSVIMS